MRGGTPITLNRMKGLGLCLDSGVDFAYKSLLVMSFFCAFIYCAGRLSAGRRAIKRRSSRRLGLVGAQELCESRGGRPGIPVPFCPRP